jgi:hypothetical protein
MFVVSPSSALVAAVYRRRSQHNLQQYFYDDIEMLLIMNFAFKRVTY